jgi:hypothetical protein
MYVADCTTPVTFSLVANKWKQPSVNHLWCLHQRVCCVIQMCIYSWGISNRKFSRNDWRYNRK